MARAFLRDVFVAGVVGGSVLMVVFSPAESWKAWPMNGAAGVVDISISMSISMSLPSAWAMEAGAGAVGAKLACTIALRGLTDKGRRFSTVSCFIKSCNLHTACSVEWSSASVAVAIPCEVPILFRLFSASNKASRALNIFRSLALLAPGILLKISRNVRGVFRCQQAMNRHEAKTIFWS